MALKESSKESETNTAEIERPRKGILIFSTVIRINAIYKIKIKKNENGNEIHIPFRFIIALWLQHSLILGRVAK